MVPAAAAGTWAGQELRRPAGRPAGGGAAGPPREAVGPLEEPAAPAAVVGRCVPGEAGPGEAFVGRATSGWTRSMDCRRRARSRRTQRTPRAWRRGRQRNRRRQRNHRRQGQRCRLKGCGGPSASSSCSAWGRRSEERRHRSARAGEVQRSPWRRGRWRGQQGAAPC